LTQDVFKDYLEYMNDHRLFKDKLFEQFARVGKALANPHRLEILDLLAQGERTVEDLAREAGMSVANTSRHLQELRAARLVEVRREGLYGYYRLADERVFAAWRAIRDLGEARLAEIDRLVGSYLTDRDSLEAVCAEELLAKMREEGVEVLDVRPEDEYRAGHIPGARSVPVERMEAYLEEIPRDREVVAYCRGPYCVFSDEAVALLRSRGYRARRLREGLPDWRAAGLPVEI
jgi:rhodanese-related sulfurtransferase/DNA-binding HxlR family transcriptional regulator